MGSAQSARFVGSAQSARFVAQSARFVAQSARFVAQSARFQSACVSGSASLASTATAGEYSQTMLMTVFESDYFHTSRTNHLYFHDAQQQRGEKRSKAHGVWRCDTSKVFAEVLAVVRLIQSVAQTTSFILRTYNMRTCNNHS